MVFSPDSQAVTCDNACSSAGVSIRQKGWRQRVFYAGSSVLFVVRDLVAAPYQFSPRWGTVGHDFPAVVAPGYM
jgi:hypothetical protein